MAYTIQKSDDTPYVHLDNGIIEISGNSLPENVLLFYNPIVSWIKEYIKNPAEKTRINLFLTYTNSCSIKYINDILKLLEDGYKRDNEMYIEWHYEIGDEASLEIGKDLESLISIPFKFIGEEAEISVKRRMRVQNIKTGKIGEISEMYWETIKRNGHAKDFKVIEYV